MKHVASFLRKVRGHADQGLYMQHEYACLHISQVEIQQSKQPYKSYHTSLIHQILHPTSIISLDL